MKVLITGGAGFVGSHLSETLLNAGHEVWVVDDLSTGNIQNLKLLRNQPNFHLVVDSILNYPIVNEIIRGVDLVYHLAAAVGVRLIVSQPVQTIQTNIRGTEIVLEIANRWRKPIVIASTSEIYGKGSKVPFKEDDDMVFGTTSKSRWSYACSKAIDEFLAFAYFREKALPVIIVRLFNTVGPRQVGQYGMVLPSFVGNALRGQPLLVYGDGLQSRTFCSIHDVVRALIQIVKCDQAWGEVFNIGSQNEITILELAKLVKQKTKSSSEIKFMSYDDAYERGFEDMKRRLPDISKIRQAIGFVPQHTIEEIIDQLIHAMGIFTNPRPAE